MTARKINPVFGAPGDDPDAVGLVQTLATRMDDLVKWARIQEYKSQHLENAVVNIESTTVEVMASLEAIARILIETNITNSEEITKYREEYLEAREAYRLAQLEESARVLAQQDSLSKSGAAQ